MKNLIITYKGIILKLTDSQIVVITRILTHKNFVVVSQKDSSKIPTYCTNVKESEEIKKNKDFYYLLHVAWRRYEESSKKNNKNKKKTIERK